MKKFFLSLLCFSLLWVMVACTPTPQKTYEEQKVFYNDIISQYTAMLVAVNNGEELSTPNTDGMDEDERIIAETLYNIVVDCKEPQNMGYGFKDFDGNGTPELVLLTRYTPIRALFTLSGDKPVLLESNYSKGNDFLFASDNRFFIMRNVIEGNIQEVTFYTCRVDGDKMSYDSICGMTGDPAKKETIERFQIVDGNRITIDEETFNDLYREHEKHSVPGYVETIRATVPRIIFPLEDKVPNEDLPVADFSSYAAIRETYKKISDCLAEFNRSEWKYGEYNDLFSFPDDRSFEYYIQLLYGAYNGGNFHMGYDETDLNGDGVDELLLLDEDYNIKAIFTQKNGIPELLDAFSYEICWIDDQGFIHVDKYDYAYYNEIEYSLYKFTKEGSYNLVYSILAANNDNRYLTQNGKTEQITFEKSLELYYDEYRCYPEPFEPCEYTRNVSELTYTPLTEPGEDLASAAVGKTWRKSAKLDKTSGSEWGAYGNTYLTFENPTDSQIDIKIKYEYIEYYPDPERDHYMLDETTVSYLDFTANFEDGLWIFDENGIKGRLEFGYKHVWLVIEESADSRFPVGHQCYDISKTYIE